MKEFFSNIFERDLWPARWNCGYWSDFHGWLYIISDISIWAAYFTIPIIILKYVLQKKHTIRFERAYLWFAAFILACGFTHLLDAGIFWIPMYRLSALLRCVTAVISWLTVYHLIKMLPKAFSLKTAEQLENEVERNKVLVSELEKSNSELKKQKQFIENIFNATRDHINVFDIHLNLISANNTTLKFLNKSMEELFGKNFNELFPKAIDNDYHHNLKKAVKGKVIENFNNRGASGKYYSTSFIPLLENTNQYAVLVIAKEMTSIIEKELTLEKFNAELNGQNEKLGKANTELEHFTYVLSHDLQEPLRKIQTYSGLLSTNFTEPNFKYVQKIDQSATRMKLLINDVLNYSKADKITEKFEPVDLNGILKSVLSDLELYITEKGASIKAEDLPTISGIKYQVNQVFHNLISNAIKYNQNTPFIEIKCKKIVISVQDKELNYYEIDFVDNGIGFDEKFKNEIFEPFKRLQTRTDYEGTGIGLALVKRIVESHNGFITAESSVNAGSVFRLTFPCL